MRVPSLLSQTYPYFEWRHIPIMMWRDIITTSIQMLIDVNSLSENGFSIFFKHLLLIFIYRLSPCIIRTPLLQLIGAVRAWPNTNVTSHKLTFKPGYHIYTFFLCHICMYTGIYFCVADIYN